jgi:four helix bundle protein
MSTQDGKSLIDLKIRTFQFSRRIIRLYASLPHKPIAQTLGRQLLRSGTSVGANHREAFRARSRAEFAAKMGDCLKELDETEYWLQLIQAENIFPSNKLHPLLQETDELIRLFVSICKTTRKKSAVGQLPKS